MKKHEQKTNATKPIILMILWTIVIFSAGFGVRAYTKRESALCIWANKNPKQAQWAKDRQDMMNEAAYKLYFEEVK